MKRSILVALVVVAVALAGCTAKKDTSTTTTATTAGGVGQGTVTGVTIEAPTNVMAGQRAVVCWNVAGSGNVGHNSIHWDTTSHANETSPTSDRYKAGTIYPGNQSTADPAGYNLPGRFCSGVTEPVTGTYYVVGHAIDKTGSPGKISTETTMRAVGDGIVTSVETPTGASTGAANSKVTLCWIAHGTGVVGHVAIHWDTQTHASKPDRTFADYAAGAAYPGNATSLDRMGYDLTPTGTTFCSTATLPASGSIFVVGHAIGKTGAPGQLSGEKVVTVA
jgi:hypothetical protein